MPPPPRLDSYSPQPLLCDPDSQTVTVRGKSLQGCVPSVGTVADVTSSSFTWVVRVTTPQTVRLTVKAGGRTSNPLSVVFQAPVEPPPVEPPPVEPPPVEPPPVEPPPPSSAYGPVAMGMPAGAVVLSPGVNIQSAINAAPRPSTFWFKAGTYSVRQSLVPRSGDKYIGELGAILDGTGWATTDLDEAAFKALNQDIDDVVIRNLEIRNMPAMGVQAYIDYSDRWTVDHCDIHHCRTGVSLPGGSTISNNKIHHCIGTMDGDNAAQRGGGYSIGNADDVTFVHNEVYENGYEQKFLMILRLICRDNWFHHNVGDGFWIDGEGQGSIVEGNLCEDNGRTGMTLEMAVGVTLRNNVSRRNATSGILLTMSRSCDVSGNTVEQNLYNFDLYLNCDTLAEAFPWQPDLANNNIHHNTVTVGSGSGRYAVILSGGIACQAPYLSNTKNNRFYSNTYTVIGDGRYWAWGAGGIPWTSWKGIPQDTDSVLKVV